MEIDLQKISTCLQNHFNNNTIAITKTEMTNDFSNMINFSISFDFNNEFITISEIYTINYDHLQDIKLMHPTIDIDNELAQIIIYETSPRYNEELLRLKLESIK